MRKFNIAEEKLAMLPAILLGDLASPEHFLNDPRPAVTPNCAAVASFGSNPLIWKVNVEYAASGATDGAGGGSAAFSARRHRNVLLAGAGFAGRRKRGVSERAEHLVEYTHSKSTIEQLMQQHCPTLPLVIARPSIVVGHTHHGCRLPAVFSGYSAWG
jgi:hypothetical protein